MSSREFRAAVLVVSDRCSRQPERDRCGPLLADRLAGHGFTVVDRSILPDEPTSIRERVREWIDRLGVELVVTAGGTGIGPRDRTPEAVRPLMDMELPGFGEDLRRASGATGRFPILSRGGAGVRGRALIIMLPGNPGAVDAVFAGWLPAIRHGVEMMSGGGHEDHSH